MDSHIVHNSEGMARGSLLRIDDWMNMGKSVYEGTIWLTRAGDQSDPYLTSGEGFVIDRSSVVLIHDVHARSAH